MYETLLEHATVADKVINSQNGRTPNELDRYHYVSVVDGTLDGYNSWGMFKDGDKPFADLDHSLSLEEDEYAIWSYSVNGEDMGEIELEALKDLTVEGEVIITAKNSDPKHVCGDNVCQPIESADALSAAMTNGGCYYLVNNIELTSKLTVSDNVVLCLNGKVISNSGNIKSAMITVEDGASLTLTDCSDADHKGYIDPETKQWAEGEYAGEGTAEVVTLKGGIIMGGNGTFGGAIIIQDKTPEETPTSLTISNVNLVNNTARQNESQTAAQGGAIYANGASTTINNATFVANGASIGGAIYATVNTKDMSIDGCTFIGNTASTNGGAIYCGGEVSVDNSTFIANVASNRGGAIFCSGYMSVNASEFIGNKTEGDSTSDGHGGAICTQGGGVDVSNSTFNGNTAYKNGGAIYVNTSNGNLVTTNNCTFVNNVAAGNGGAVYVTGTGKYVDGTNVDGEIFGGSTFGEYTDEDGQTVAAGNSATNGGAIGTYGTVTLYGTVFKNNTAEIGGAMYALQDDGKTNVVTVEGCTFENNRATVNSKNIGGGAIAVTKSITVNIIGGKFIGNSSAYYGGAISVGKATSSGTGDTNANISISGGTIFENNKGTTGSALWFKVSGTISVDTITVKDNTGATNGVIYIGATGSEAFTFNNVTATGNQANKGGVFYISGGVVEITNSRLTGNTASGNDGLGGAIYVSTSNTLTLKGCTISGNEAKVGGGVYATKSFTADEATQITDNTDSSEGADTDNVYPAA